MVYTWVRVLKNRKLLYYKYSNRINWAIFGLPFFVVVVVVVVLCYNISLCGRVVRGMFLHRFVCAYSVA